MFLWLDSDRIHEKDTDKGGGQDGKDGANRNRLLSIFQISGSVWSSHDTFREGKESKLTSWVIEHFGIHTDTDKD